MTLRKHVLSLWDTDMSRYFIFRSKTISYSTTKRFDMKTREIAIQPQLELDRKLCNGTNLNDKI